MFQDLGVRKSIKQPISRTFPFNVVACACPWGSWTFKMSPTTYYVETSLKVNLKFSVFLLYRIDKGRKWTIHGIKPVLRGETLFRGKEVSYGIRFRSLFWFFLFSFWPPHFKVLFFISSFFFYSSIRSSVHGISSIFSPPPQTKSNTHSSLVRSNFVFYA